MAELSVWEGISLIIGAVLGGGGIYGKQAIRKARNNNNNANKEKSSDDSKLMTVKQHDRECDLKLQNIATQINSSVENIGIRIEAIHGIVSDIKNNHACSKGG